MKCAICQTDTDRPVYCSKKCAATGNQKNGQRRYYRVASFFQMHHKVQGVCESCNEAYARTHKYQRFCSKGCGVTWRQSGGEYEDAIVVNQTVDLQVQTNKGKTVQRKVRLTLVAGTPTLEQRNKLKEPYVIRNNAQQVQEAWEGIQASMQRAKVNGQMAQFSRYIINLAG